MRIIQLRGGAVSSCRIAFLACAFVVFGAMLVAAPRVSAAFPGASGKIAFSSDRDSPPACEDCARGDRDVFTMDSSGTGQTNETDPSSGAMPAWSPDGDKIAFERSANLWVMNADGSGPVQLTLFNDCCTKVMDPAWSPDGAKIVYARTEPAFDPELQQLVTGPTNLYVVNSDGTDPIRLTNTFSSSEVDPAWSPDGLEIMFESPNGLEVMSPDGTGRTSLGVNGATPSWSPDGGKVAFAQDGDISVMNADGGGQVQLTTDPADDHWPAWAPDGSRIAFASERDGSYEIYVMNANGTGQTRLTADHDLSPPAEAIDPDWQPLSALDPFPRPGGGSPLRVPLVPSFASCTAPNTQHAPPLDSPACAPAEQEPSILTTSTIGRGLASARLLVQPGNTGTPEDEADMRIVVQATDVRCGQTTVACPAGPGSDYTGKVLLRTAIRLTDRASGFGGVSATVEDVTLDIPVDCVPTDSTLFGSTCARDTTLDAIIPNLIREGKRMIFSVTSLTIDGPGPSAPAGCPPACENESQLATYLRQGLFVP